MFVLRGLVITSVLLATHLPEVAQANDQQLPLA